jgi:hypothetical protein
MAMGAFSMPLAVHLQVPVKVQAACHILAWHVHHFLCRLAER